jgi:hypothetical protein
VPVGVEALLCTPTLPVRFSGLGVPVKVAVPAIKVDGEGAPEVMFKLTTWLKPLLPTTGTDQDLLAPWTILELPGGVMPAQVRLKDGAALTLTVTESLELPAGLEQLIVYVVFAIRAPVVIPALEVPVQFGGVTVQPPLALLDVQLIVAAVL